MKLITTTALVSALLAGASFISMAAETPYVGYRVTKVVTLPGKNPRWDHLSVDPINRHLFIGRRADGLTVVNIDTGEVSSVSDTKGEAPAQFAYFHGGAVICRLVAPQEQRPSSRVDAAPP
jgi:hypothetical protein